MCGVWATTPRPLAPGHAAPRLHRDEEDGIAMYATESYNLHHYETPTGLHFVLMTSPAVAAVGGTLTAMYADAYVPFVARNPVQPVGEAISNPAFRQVVDKLVVELTTQA